MTLLAAFNVLLYRYANQADLVVGTPIANRSKLEVERVIGYFLNTLLIRSDLSGNPTFAELVERVRATCLEAYAHQDLHFEKLVQELRPQRDNNRNPFFTVMFVLNQNYPTPDVHVGDLTASYMPIPRDVARFDLIMYYFESPNGDAVQLNYNTDIFDHSSMTRMLEHFMTLLEHIVQQSAQRIDQLPLMQPWEQARVLSTWNESRQAYPVERCPHELFEAQAARDPEAIALVFEPDTRERVRLSYGQLNARANQLAHELRRRGVGPDVLVGISIERSLELFVAVLAILKAGGAYVPLDPGYPQERLEFMLHDTRTPLLLTQESLRGRLSMPADRTIFLDTDWPVIARQPQTNPGVTVAADNLAYVIYTSGSTGQPKGVLISHRQITRLFSATESWFHFGPQDVWTLFHSEAFDFSVWEIWGALLYGGRLVIVPYLVSRSPEAFYDLLQAEQVTVLNQTPSAFRQLTQAVVSRPQSSLALRYVIFGGEALELQALQPWLDRFGDAQPQLVNMYGITETTVHVTYRPIHAADLTTTPGSMIGLPIPDLQLYVLDHAGQPTPVGVPGELYVGGAGVARGYLNRPALTAERFLPDPFTQTPGARLYKTGDQARLLPNGDLQYLGRIDQQVKLRGFRIELGEIEAVLRQHPQIRDAVVVAREDGADKQLIAYVVPDAQQPAEPQALQDFLKTRLPVYMLPSRLVTLDSFPLTANGKLDRRALPAPDQARPDLQQAYVAPRNATETVLAEILAEVLGVERVGIHDDFFALGGHSLGATQIMVRVREIFRTEIATAAIFDTPTVAGFAEALTAQEPKPGQIEKIAQLHQRIKHLSKADLQKMVQQKQQ